MAPSILIADDHQLFRTRARRLLESGGYRVIGEADSAYTAIAETRRLRPDVLLLDVQLPDRDGIAVAAEIAAEPSHPMIVLISSREAADYGTRLETAPVSAFIHKPDLTRARLDELIAASS